MRTGAYLVRVPKTCCVVLPPTGLKTPIWLTGTLKKGSVIPGLPQNTNTAELVKLTSSPIIWEAEAGEWGIPGQPGL